MSQLNVNPHAVSSVLAAFAFNGVASLDAAAATLQAQLAQSMQAPSTYSLPLDGVLPQGMPGDQAFVVVHPHNIVAALFSIIAKRNELVPAEQAAASPSLQVHTDAGWTLITNVTAQLYAVNVVMPAPVAPAPVAAPAPAPVVAVAPTPVAPAPVAPVASPDALSTLVDAAMAATPAAPVAAVAAPAAPVAVAEPVDAPVAAPVAPQTVAASPAPIEGTATHVAPTAAAPAAAAGGSGLPNASVVVERIGAAGRPQTSPFTKEVKPRNKVADPGFWWAPLLHSAKALFTQSPAQALDPSSDGSGPVQAYAVLVALERAVLKDVPGELTVAQLRLYLDQVATDINAQPSAAAINQLVEKMFPAQ